MKIPFLHSKKDLKINDLQEQIDLLSNQLEEEIDNNIQYMIQNKSIIDSNGSEPISGQFGLVDENYDKAMLQKLYMTETWFYIVVSTIAKSIASLPFILEKRKLIKQRVTHSNGETEDVYKETWIEASAEPEAEIFKYPNDLQPQMEFWMLVIIDLLSTGESFIYTHKTDMKPMNGGSEERLQNAISRIRKTDVDALFRLNSAMTEVVPSEDEEKVIEGYVLMSDKNFIGFEPKEIIHIKLPNPSSSFNGLAPIVAVMKKVLLDRYTDEHHIRFYKQGARLGGAIETTKKLTKEQMVRLTKTFENNFTGKRQHHKTLILPEGMKYKIIEQSPVDSALIEFAKTNKEPILSAYNVPPIKIGLLDGATFANALIQNKTYYTDTIMPLTKLIEQAINMNEEILRSTRNLRFRFDFSEIEALQEDYKAKSESAKAMAEGGMTINEVRQEVWGLPPIDGGDVTPALRPASSGFSMLAAPPTDTKVDANNAQNDTSALVDIVPTKDSFEARVAQLINEAVAQGIDLGLATQRAIQQALEEGFELALPKDESKGADHYHIDQNGRRTGPALMEGSGLHSHALKDENGSEIGMTSSETGGPDHTHICCGTERTSGPRGGKDIEVPFSKESLAGYAKEIAGEGADAMIADHREEAVKFLKRLEDFIISKTRRKAYRKEKGFGIKASLPTQDDLKKFIEEESVKSAETLIKATKHGYKVNIPSKSLTFPNKEATTILKKVATRNVKSIAQSSLKQLKNIITSSQTDQVSVGELSSRIRDAFTTITEGKANTIARTETLTAVSIGQDLKSKVFKEMFPKDAKRLKRIWITSNDTKVRDSHEHLEGEVVDVGEKFANGLKYPRDPAGDASEIINCRCSFIDFLPEDQDTILDIFKSASSEVKITRGENETYDECVQRGIAALIDEGKDPDQAVAMAHSMCKL